MFWVTQGILSNTWRHLWLLQVAVTGLLGGRGPGGCCRISCSTRHAPQRRAAQSQTSECCCGALAGCSHPLRRRLRPTQVECGPRPGLRQESTREGISKWNKKSALLSHSLKINVKLFFILKDYFIVQHAHASFLYPLVCRWGLGLLPTPALLM